MFSKMKSTQILFSLFLVYLLSINLSCTKKNTFNKPEPIIWDRHRCAQCGMAISNPQFAAQIIGSDKKVYSFDDIGCSIEWSHNHKNMKALKYWVKDFKTKEWLEVQSAHWTSHVPNTPMGYGFSASKNKSAKTQDFNKVKDSVILKMKTRRSKRPSM